MQAEPNTKKIILKHLLAAGLGLAVIFVLIRIAGHRKLAELISLHPAHLLATLLATAAMVGCVGYRWRILVDSFSPGRDVPVLALSHHFVKSRILGFVIPKDLSDIGLRALLLRNEQNVPVPAAVLSVLGDRVSDIFWCAIFVVPSLAYCSGTLTPPQSLAFFGIMFAVGIAALSAAGRMRIDPKGMPDWLRRLVHRILRKPTDYLDQFGAWTPGRRATLCIGTWSLAKYAFSCIRLICVAQAFGLEIEPLHFILGLPLAQLSYLLAFTPGGIGIQELGWAVILMLCGVPTPETVTFVVGLRVLSVLAIVCVWLAINVTGFLSTVRLRAVPERGQG